MRRLALVSFCLILTACTRPTPTPSPAVLAFGHQLQELHTEFQDGTAQYNRQYQSMITDKAPKADLIRLHHAEWRRLDTIRVRVLALPVPNATCATIRDDYAESVSLAQRAMEQAIVYALLGDRDIGEQANRSIDASRGLRESALSELQSLLPKEPRQTTVAPTRRARHLRSNTLV